MSLKNISFFKRLDFPCLSLPEPVKLSLEICHLLKHVKFKTLFQSFDFLYGYADTCPHLYHLNISIVDEPSNCAMVDIKIIGNLLDVVILP